MAEAQGRESAPAGTDVERLAEQVYRLMLAEARLERARGVMPRRRGGE
jgi:hypothetical protein